MTSYPLHTVNCHTKTTPYKSNNKSVTVEELKVGLMEKGIDVKPEHLDLIMKRFDPKKTGNLCYTQFLEFLMGTYL